MRLVTGPSQPAGGFNARAGTCSHGTSPARGVARRPVGQLTRLVAELVIGARAQSLQRRSTYNKIMPLAMGNTYAAVAVEARGVGIDRGALLPTVAAGGPRRGGELRVQWRWPSVCLCASEGAAEKHNAAAGSGPRDHRESQIGPAGTNQEAARSAWRCRAEPTAVRSVAGTSSFVFGGSSATYALLPCTAPVYAARRTVATAGRRKKRERSQRDFGVGARCSPE